MHDLEDGSAGESKYECLKCGNIVAAGSHPTSCPECDGGMQNRAMSLE